MPDIQSRQYTAGIAVMNAGKPLAALNGDIEPIFERLHGNETISQIAKSLNITSTALYAWLLQHAPDRWQAVSSAKQLARLDEAEKVFDDRETDSLDISRARESARLAMWNLSKTSKLYADKQDANSGINIQVVISNPLEQAHVVVDNPLIQHEIVPAKAE